jgi:hypothetical protein
MYTVYSVLLSPLWLKSVSGWSAISVSTFQQFRVGQIVWFGSLSAISQLASRGGGMGSWATLCLHSVTQPYTTCPRWREQGGGLRSLPLSVHHNFEHNGNYSERGCACTPHPNQPEAKFMDLPISLRFLGIILRVPDLRFLYGFLNHREGGMAFLLSPLQCTITDL